MMMTKGKKSYWVCHVCNEACELRASQAIQKGWTNGKYVLCPYCNGKEKVKPILR